MTLIPLWEGRIILPSYIRAKKSIGKNYLSQVVIQECSLKAVIFEAEYKGYQLIRTDLEKPFDTIYWKKKKTKFLSELNNQLVLSNVEGDNEDFTLTSKLKWFNIPCSLKNSLSPSEVVESWNGRFLFREVDEEKDQLGLRPPQLGAIHSISAHFITGRIHDAATIVLPTGTGKTETMLATLAHRRLPKLLVLIPTNVLRTQLTEKFLNFGILPLIGVLPYAIQRPWVATITKGISSVKEAKEIVLNTNVIVATPQILESSNIEAIKVICDSCTDLFIDEAHHSPASTWEKIRKYFLDKRICQFTATPFRNDEKEIGGKIIYNYKLGDAQKDGYYKPIRFYPIEEYGDESKCDLVIAQKAIEILNKDLKNQNMRCDHILLVRAKDKKKADVLHQLYSRLSPKFNPVIVHSDKTSFQNKTSLSKILDRESRIIICVDMLGEGFDLPQLKIAAIHDYHKSLAITLQFIGRFTRTSSNVGDAAVILNIADPSVENGLEKLYAANAEWDNVIKRLSEEEIDREIRLQELIEKLKSNGSLSRQISLRSLHPTFTAQIYKVKTNEWNPLRYREIFSGNNYFHSISTSPKLLIIMGILECDVTWGKFQDINDIIHKLFIAYWDETKSALFIYCNDYDGFRVDKIVNAIFDNKVELVAGPKVFNILNNVELPLVKNLGSSRAGVISFTQYFGPNVTEGLSEIEKNESNLSNIACLGYEDGEKVLWGAAQRKGKIWSMTGGTIDEWMSWCNRIWTKVDSGISEDNITQNFLRPYSLETYHSATPISIDWGERIQLFNYDKIFIHFVKNAFPLYLVEVDINNLGNRGPSEIIFSTDVSASVYLFEINKDLLGGYKYSLISGPPIFFQVGRSEPKSLEEHVISDPFIINYNDGSFSYNKYLIKPNFDQDPYNRDYLEVWNWDNIFLNKESMGKEQARDSIQYRTYELVYDDYDIIINDDGKGEAGDLVCLKEIDDKTINLTLVHCKNAINARPGADIRDLYTVCGQAQKSIKVKHRGMKELYNEIKKREALWQQDGHTRFLKGTMEEFVYYKNKSRTTKIEFHIIIVQPGISRTQISEDMLRLLSTTELFIKKTCQGTLRVAVNE